ncbi:MAG TPA: hypothetical protein VIL18_00190 [Longimicrobiales bacterium]
MRRTTQAALAALVLALGPGCARDGSTDPDPGEEREVAVFPVLGLGPVPERYTAEVAVRDGWAYTTTWGGASRLPGNAVKIWDVSGDIPVLVDSLIIDGALTTGDVQISDDGALLVVATEYRPGSIVVFDRSDPARPRQLSRFQAPSTLNGVHTVKLGRVDGRLYAFLSVNPSPPQLVVVDLTDPAAPQEVLVRPMGRPFVHDVFVRDGLLFTALWDDGVTIWGIGPPHGGSPADPVQLGNVRTVGGSAHNIWWFDDGGARRYVFVGEEVPLSFGHSSAGDIHVVDITDIRAPREVAFFHVDSAGTHNFVMDEANGILYAAYYNNGVVALDVRGDLGSCAPAARAPDGRCDLGAMGRQVGRGLQDVGQPVFVWGVQLAGGRLYASDMLNGLFALDVSVLRRRAR